MKASTFLGALSALSLVFMAPLCQAAPAGMTAVEEAAAKVEIQEVLYRYALYHNTNNPEAYANLFTADADLMGIKGHDAILKMAQGEVSKMGALGISNEGDYRFGFMRSEIINPVVDVADATHAKSVSYLQVVVPNVDNGNLPTILSLGTYQDDFQKVDGRWLISRRRATNDALVKDQGLGAKLGLGPGGAKPKPAEGAAPPK